jgi:nucleoside-diphosphate-sugar epimerase
MTTSQKITEQFLITGAPGWLGNRLLYTLVSGNPEIPGIPAPDPNLKVRCLVKPGFQLPQLTNSNNQVEEIIGDLRDPKMVQVFCQGATNAILVHCAGVVHPERSPKEFFEINFEGTRNLLQAAEAAGIRKAVVISSNSPIGTNPNRGHLFDEQSPYNPYMGYGRSKMMLEKVTHEFQQRGKIETVILRPTWFYGPDQPIRQTTFFKMIRGGTAPILGDGGNLRSMVYIDNLIQAVLLAAQSATANGQTYWVADRRPYSMNEIVDTVERLMEKEFGLKVAHKRLRLPSMAGEIAWLADFVIQNFGLYQQKIHVLSEMNKNIACSIGKAEKELGYSPKIELEEGMRRSLAWCIKQGIPL